MSRSRFFLITAFILFSCFSFGQDLNEKIKKIETVDQANGLIKSYPNLNGQLIELNSGADSADLAKQLFATKMETPLSIDGYTYKIVKVKKSVLLRASYIYLDANKLTVSKIDSLRKIIIFKYNNGTSFPDLAKEYNMDGNPGCDLGWFPPERMVKEFSRAVGKHKKDEIFTIDIPGKKWYYVTLKTFNDKEIKVLTVLKIKRSD